MLSSSSSCSGLTVATMTVRQLPPRLSFSTDVIMELRYGMWPRPLPLLRSCSATMTCGRMAAWVGTGKAHSHVEKQRADAEKLNTAVAQWRAPTE